MSEPTKPTPELARAAWAAVERALARARSGEPHHETCVFCGQPLIVEPASPYPPVTQWLIRCPCGNSNGVVKGL